MSFSFILKNPSDVTMIHPKVVGKTSITLCLKPDPLTEEVPKKFDIEIFVPQ
jgi:hypothetical protein